MRQRRSSIVVIYCIAMMIVLVVSVGLEWYRFVYQPIPIQPGESVIIRIDKASTASSFAHTLHVQGWIKSPRLWICWVKMQRLSTQLKAGIYQIQPGESVQQLLQKIVKGAVLQKTFLIKPGTTQQEIIASLKTAPYLDYKADDWSVLAMNHPVPEGLLLADTYAYDAGSSGKILIQRAHTHLNEVLNRAWQTRQVNLPYQTPYELLIAASIIEKESALPAERRLIAGVIVNRLRLHMPLQMDPTVIYALGPLYHGSLSHEQLSYDSPYNTYRYRGLPPTPIAMVGIDAIEAARDPDIQSYLYFVAKGDGSHTFSSNYATHRQAVQRYQSARKDS